MKITSPHQSTPVQFWASQGGGGAEQVLHVFDKSAYLCRKIFKMPAVCHNEC